MPFPFRHRTTKKESRRSAWPTVAALEERIEEIMDQLARAGDDHVELAEKLMRLGHEPQARPLWQQTPLRLP